MKYSPSSWIDRGVAILIDVILLSFLSDYLPANYIYYELLPQEYISNFVELICTIEYASFYPAYFIGTKTFWNGQTLGKRVLRIKTLKENGNKLNLFHSAIDSFGYLFWPLDLLLGIFFSPNGDQRLTQLMSRTVVVIETPYNTST